jgi:hypothetical protein
MEDYMTSDMAELKAMAEIASIFAGLEEEEIQRVLRWVNEKYRMRPGGTAPTAAVNVPGLTAEKKEFADLPALYDVAKPTNGLERILVGAYFYQVIKGEADFDSQSLNTQLKHLGYPSSNITRDMESLVNRSPKLAIQTRKEGTTQQARKKFRLTMEGVRAVEAMLLRGGAQNT